MKRISLIKLGLFVGMLLTATAGASPIATLPALVSVNIYEWTSGLVLYSHSPGDPVLLNRLPGGLGPGNRDAASLASEYYDFFYSDAAGNADPNGAYVSVEAFYTNTNGSGLNLAAVELVFGSGSQFATFVSSFVQGIGQFQPASVNNAVDGALNTATFMGFDQSNRMRVTVGFPTSTQATPEPATWATAAVTLLLLGWRYFPRKRKVIPTVTVSG